jgi:hypothetical protein
VADLRRLRGLRLVAWCGTLRGSPISAGDATRRRPAAGTASVRVAGSAPVDAVEDGDLAAYNRYLSWLNANPGARPGDYPG